MHPEETTGPSVPKHTPTQTEPEPTHTPPCRPLQSQKHPLPGSNQIQTRTKAPGPRSRGHRGAGTAEPHRGQDSQLLLHFIAAATPGAPVSSASFFLGHLRGFAPPHPASCSLSCPCSAGAPLGAPQSLRQVGESWEWCGRVGPGPANIANIANIAVWGLCSGLIWGRKAVGARDRGLGDSAITCSVTPEKDPTLSAPQFPSL